VTNLYITNKHGAILDRLVSLRGRLCFRTITYDNSKDEYIEVIEPIVIELRSHTDSHFSEVIHNTKLKSVMKICTDEKERRQWEYSTLSKLYEKQITFSIRTNRTNINIYSAFAKYIFNITKELQTFISLTNMQSIIETQCRTNY
jgi:hypothetical protein